MREDLPLNRVVYYLFEGSYDIDFYWICNENIMYVDKVFIIKKINI